MFLIILNGINMFSYCHIARDCYDVTLRWRPIQIQFMQTIK